MWNHTVVNRAFTTQFYVSQKRKIMYTRTLWFCPIELCAHIDLSCINKWRSQDYRYIATIRWDRIEAGKCTRRQLKNMVLRYTVYGKNWRAKRVRRWLVEEETREQFLCEYCTLERSSSKRIVLSPRLGLGSWESWILVAWCSSWIKYNGMKKGKRSWQNGLKYWALGLEVLESFPTKNIFIKNRQNVALNFLRNFSIIF